MPVVGPLAGPFARRTTHRRERRCGSPAGVSLLERLVNINSGTHNFAGVRAVADALAPEFQKLGFTTRWSEGASWNRAGHLIAEWKGNGTGRKLAADRSSRHGLRTRLAVPAVRASWYRFGARSRHRRHEGRQLS